MYSLSGRNVLRPYFVANQCFGCVRPKMIVFYF